MTDLEKAKYIVEKIETDENFDLIDYYAIEKRTPADFVRKVKSKLSTDDTRILASFASSNIETSEWKERHYVIFFETKNILSGMLVTKEDKEKIINELLDMGLSINDKTVRVMMKRYVRLTLEKENAPKLMLKK